MRSHCRCLCVISKHLTWVQSIFAVSIWHQYFSVILLRNKHLPLTLFNYILVKHLIKKYLHIYVLDMLYLMVTVSQWLKEDYLLDIPRPMSSDRLWPVVSTWSLDSIRLERLPWKGFTVSPEQGLSTLDVWHFRWGEWQAPPEVASEVRPKPCGTGSLVHRALCLGQNLLNSWEEQFYRFVPEPRPLEKK